MNEQTMEQEKALERAVAVVGDLPSIPTITSQVMIAAGDPSTSAEDMQDILEQDPSLSARILKVANSSLYGFRREVETLQHAITLLGFRNVENLVMAASLRDVFKNFGLAEKLIWEHSTMAGVIAARLATMDAVDVPRDAAFTASIEAERDEFGFDHAALGSRVADKWKLPKRLVHAVRYHHHDPDAFGDIPPEHARLAALTTVTSQCCQRLGFGRRSPDLEADPSALPAWTFIGLAEDELEAVLSALLDEAGQAAGLFG